MKLARTFSGARAAVREWKHTLSATQETFQASSEPYKGWMAVRSLVSHPVRTAPVFALESNEMTRSVGMREGATLIKTKLLVPMLEAELTQRAHPSRWSYETPSPEGPPQCEADQAGDPVQGNLEAGRRCRVGLRLRERPEFDLGSSRCHRRCPLSERKSKSVKRARELPRERMAPPRKEKGMQRQRASSKEMVPQGNPCRRSSALSTWPGRVAFAETLALISIPSCQIGAFAVEPSAADSDNAVQYAAEDQEWPPSDCTNH